MTNSHILIVDDDMAIRDSMQEFLEMADYNAVAVASAEEAVPYLKANSVDIVITDILMAGMDGLELTDLIKREFDAEVIVMTGYSADYSYEEAINKGASDFVFKPVRFEELILRLKRVMKERCLRKDRDLMVEKLKNLAITDGLTKLFNSRHFYEQLTMEIDRFNRYNHPLSLLLLDIDHFKQFNDRFGHLEGDKVLIMLGQVIKACLRTLDTGYRYGGEEFTIILPETSPKEAVVVAERIRASLQKERLRPHPGLEVAVTISIGISEYHPGEELSSLVQRADKAMYLSKKNGRDRISTLSFEEHATLSHHQ